VNDHIDPLRVLHGDDRPVDPDPAFAARLRRRLEFALSLPEGVDMSDTVLDTRPAAGSDARPAAVPYLAVADARAAIDWYVTALGAAQIGDPIVMEDGRIGHAELALAGGVLYLADEYPEIGLKAPAPQAVSVSLMVTVPNTDAALSQARRHGATVQREPYENHGSRTAVIIDPFGHRWMLSGPVTGLPTPIRHGDIGYVEVCTPDAHRAAAFYGSVLGWTIDPSTDRITNVDNRIRLVGTPGEPTLRCGYAVDDLDGARQSILAAGGSVGDLTHTDAGTALAATDPAGTAFAVFSAAPGVGRPALNGSGPGDLSYVTYEVADSAAFRAFYGRLFSWTFEPGRIPDGWGVVGAQPMSGAAGGTAAPATVPMWTVADIASAVERVTAAGGTVLQAPTRQDYGLMAECTDDQGTRFYLGQF
jgi:predicted enzyme related to lactoylglutathione lyase